MKTYELISNLLITFSKDVLDENNNAEFNTALKNAIKSLTQLKKYY